MPENIEQLERYEIFPEAAEALGIERYLSQKDRDAIDDSDFAGPSQSFPIDSQEHLDAAAKLIGHADDPDAVKAKAIKIAKRKGFILPKAWEEEEKPVNKTDEADILRTMPSELQIYAPILRIDKEKREVTLRATSEAEDSYGTVIDFNGSKEAFGKWKGNIREMHQNIAVGRAFKVDPVEDQKAVDITLRVSKGAEDTWQKVLDGTLAGGSIGAKKGKWGQREINGKNIPVLERYELVEVSLVDNPSNPDCNISVVRADGIATEVLDSDTAPTVTTTTTQTPDTARAGAKHSADTMNKMHSGRDHSIAGLKDQLDACGCDECSAVSKKLDPDDGGASGDGSGDGEARAMAALIDRLLAEKLPIALDAWTKRSMTPTIQRFNGIAAQLAQTNIQPETQQQSPDIERRLGSIESKFSGLDEVRSIAIEVRDLAKRIAEQPQQPQPIVNTSAVNPDVLRMFQRDPAQQQTQQQDLTEMARSGRLDRQQQVNAAVAFLTGNNGSRR